jgi:two-component system LytT family response regulator
MDRIRVLIVDDEAPARAKLRRFLAADPEVEVVGEAGSGTEAVEAVRALAPDVVFLDIQMPGLDGFGVVAALEGEPLPQVVFVTAYDEFAVKAFEVHAVDYLLKPFGPDRFARALTRVKERVRARRDDGLDRRLRTVLAAVTRRPTYLERILVPDGGKSVLLEVSRIDWIEAEGNHVRLHVGTASHLVRATLAALEERLDPARFLRIHRSRIVNADRIREVHPWSHGDQLVALRDGTELIMSRRYRDRLARLEL